MGKNKYFSTKSVFGQLISLIDDSMIQKAVKKHDSDRYVKHFKCNDHFFFMVFCCLEKCNSLREVTGEMLGLRAKRKLLESIIFQKRLLWRTQTRVGKWCFLKKFITTCSRNIAFFCRTAELR